MRTQPWCQSMAWALSISFPAIPWYQGWGGTTKGGTKMGGGPKISRFFFLSPSPIFTLFVSLRVFSWFFGGASNVHIWSRVAGVSHDNQSDQTCTFEGPGLPREDTQ